MTTGEKRKIIGYWTHNFVLRDTRSEAGNIFYYGSYSISTDMDHITIPLMTHDYHTPTGVIDEVIKTVRAQAMQLCDVLKESR